MARFPYTSLLHYAYSFCSGGTIKVAMHDLWGLLALFHVPFNCHSWWCNVVCQPSSVNFMRKIICRKYSFNFLTSFLHDFHKFSTDHHFKLNESRVRTHWTDKICLALSKISTKYFNLSSVGARRHSKIFVNHKPVSITMEIDNIALALFPEKVTWDDFRSHGFMVIFNRFDWICCLGILLLIF